MRLLFLALMTSAFFITSCGNETTSNEKNTSESKDSVQELSIVNNGIELASFPESPSYDNARIDNFQYQNGTFSYKIPDGEYKLGAQTSDADIKMCANSVEGQHIHLIVNDEPYYAYYTDEFDKEIAEGKHHILTFLSRSYHESIKTPEARRAVHVEVKGGEFISVDPIRDPMLFYSRPKGAYIGNETENVMLDFYPVNLTLAKDAYTVQVDINDNASFTIHDWKPYYLKGLPMGENTIKLTLLDKDGNIVDTPLNPVSQTITLKADPAVN